MVLHKPNRPSKASIVSEMKLMRTMSAHHELKSDLHEYNSNGCADCHRPFTFVRRRKACWSKLCQKPLCHSCVAFIVLPAAQVGMSTKQRFGLAACCKDWCVTD